MFNVYEKTHRFRGKTAKDSPASAGAAKIPRVGVNKSDLEAQGELYGWTARPLSYNEVREMSSSELRWHEKLNAANLEKALATPAKAREGKDRAIKKLWDNQTQATPEQAAEIWNALQRFRQAYPQFLPRAENEIVLLWLKERNMLVTFENLVQAFEANALEGRLYLNPSAIGAGSESEVIGPALTSHHNFPLLIQPQRRMSETDRLSAQEFYNEHKELHPTQVSPFALQKKQKVENTQAYFAQTSAATSESNVVRVTNYGQQTHGVPPEPDKYSFKQKIRSMSASEIAQRCQDDPTFRKALDELK